MIGFIRGNVIGVSEGTILLENNGIGYEIVCSGEAFASLANAKSGQVYTYLQVKEDGLTLFGFVSEEEKRMFLKLITVSGVGPKMGIAVLSNLNINEIAAAIATSDVKRLSSVKGLGKKTAERMILELREKVTAEELLDKSEVSAVELSAADDDAVLGLMSLGYTKSESVKAIKAARDSGCEGVEQMIFYALKNM